MTEIEKTLTKTEKLTKHPTDKSVDEILKASNKVVIKPAPSNSGNKNEMLLLVLLDGSGSMIERMPMSGLEKMKVAWQVLQQDLMPNMAGWSYGIKLIGGRDQTPDSWFVQPTASPLLVASMPTPWGGTPIGQFLQSSWRWVSDNAQSCRFILLSDGWPDGSPNDILHSAIDHKSIPIDTVGIGIGLSDMSYNSEFLKQLSEITGGIFCEANSASMLSEQIKKLSPSNRPLLGKVE